MIQNLIDRLGKDQWELIKGGSTAFIVRILGIILLYVLTLYITNNFGAEIYGEFTFFQLSLKILSILSIAGLDAYLLRYISENPSKSNIQILNNQGSVSVVIHSLILIALVYFLGPYCYQYFFSDSIFLTILVICLLPFAIIKINAESFRALKKSLIYSLYEYGLIPLFTLIILFGIHRSSIEVQQLPTVAYTIALLLIFLISLFQWQLKNIGSIVRKFKDHIADIPSTNKKSFPFLIAGSILFIGQWTISFILKYFEGNVALGNFDAALKIAYLLMIPLTAASVIAAPIFSKRFSDSKEEKLKSILKFITNGVLLVTLPLALILFFYSTELMSLYGSEFTESGNILKIIVVGIFFNSITGPIAVFLQMTENQSIVQNVFLISTLLNIVLAFFLIPSYGIEGAAWSNLIFQIFVNGVLLYYVYKKFGYLSFGV